jgi:ectoine hydroxylase-related dioxygenase (phytanoyl-CoA dioxygenase family)
VDGNQPLHKLLYDGRMIAFYEKFLGKPVGHYDHTWVRLCMPNQPATIPHCDVVYMGRGTHDLYTSWTPIGDAPIADGPLCVISRSHRIQKLRDHYCQTDVDAVCTNRQKPDGTKMMQNPTFGELSRNPPRMRKALGLPFLTTDYEAGDLLIFTVFTIHCALDNHGHRVRISTDTRYQAADEPQDDRWISIKGAPPTMHEEASRREMIC